MPANVEAMMSVREMPWHREGVVLDNYPGSWAEARVPAGLDWDPIWRPLFNPVNLVWVPEQVTGEGDDQQIISAHWEPVRDAEGKPEELRFEEDPEFAAIVRSDTGATLYHRKPETFQLITNTELGEIVEAILGTDNAKYETAGSLEGGRGVWCLVKLDEPVQIKGNGRNGVKDNSMTLPYIAITNRHDGWGACVARSTAVRIVCANTWRAAEMEGKKHGATFKFVHRGSWRDQVEQARLAVTAVRREFADYQILMQGLLGLRVTAAQRELFVTEFLPMPPSGIISARVAGNVEDARGRLREILGSETTRPIWNTAGGLVQAAGEYLDHVRTAQTWETRLRRTVLTPEALKSRAVLLAREVQGTEITQEMLDAAAVAVRERTATRVADGVVAGDPGKAEQN